MSEHISYEDDGVFEKLEKEANRHHHSSRHRRTYNRKPADPTGSGKTADHAVHTSGRKETENGSIKREKTSPSSSEAKSKTEHSADLSNEIYTDLKQNPNGVSASQPVRRSTGQHSHEHRKKAAEKNPAKKRSPWIRAAGFMLALIVILGIGGYGFINSKLNKIVHSDGTEDVLDVDDEFDRVSRFDVDHFEPKLMTSDDVTNILLIGQDRRKGDAAKMRSDAMIVCSINRRTKEITLSSLMRDMYLPVPGKGYGMINATYLAGGFPLLNKTIEKNFGIRIDGNVEVDFERFIGLMTLIGPIDLELSQAEADHLNQSGYNFRSGINTMNAEQVLAYCRMRKDIGGDWGRTDRQRKVLTRLYSELKTSGMPTIYRFIDEALPLFRTDLSNRQIIKLAYAMVAGRMGIRHSYRLPEEGTYTQEIREEDLHVLIPDLRENSRRLQKYIYGYLEK